VRVDEAPLRTLGDLVQKRTSGEFICASASAEVHVFLQRGRVAWATDSQHPFAFTRYLQTSAGIDADGFRDILDSCKRERRPLGETLVAWGLVTREEIRAALRHQLELALTALRHGGAAQTLFLDRTRQFEHYDESLTFALDELLSGATVEDGGATSSRRRAPSQQPPSTGPRSAPSLARRLFELTDDIRWAEVLEGTTRIESEPDPHETLRFSAEIVESTLRDEAEVAIFRLPEGLLAGIALPGSRSLWCRLAPESTVGAAAAALGAFGEPGPRESFGPARGKPWTHCADGDPNALEMRALLERAPEMLGAFVLDSGDARESCGVGCSPLTLDEGLDTVRRRARALAVEQVFQDGTESRADVDGVGFRFRSMVTAERRFWCFGAQLSGCSQRTVWILLSRQCSQGLGWAYLTSLGRSLMHLGEGRARA
jgi:hypothetical protein